MGVGFFGHGLYGQRYRLGFSGCGIKISKAFDVKEKAEVFGLFQGAKHRLLHFEIDQKKKGLLRGSPSRHFCFKS
jgi:hypothetical protein